MVFDYLADINWLAVLVAAIAYYAIGSIWYSNALMGKQYRRASSVAVVVGRRLVVILFVGWFVTAAALAWFFAGIGVTDVVDGIIWGLVASVGFIGMNRWVGQAYGADSAKLMKIDGPYHLIGFAAMGAILAAM